MKILVVSQYYYPEPFKINEICEALVTRGISVSVLTGMPNYPSGKIVQEYKQNKRMKESINEVTVYRVPIIPRGNNMIKLLMNYISFPISAMRTLNTINSEFDCILCYQLSPVFMEYIAYKAKKKYRCPLITYCLDLWPESIMAYKINKKSLIYKCVHWISNYLYAKSDKICVTSPSFISYLNQVNKVSIEKISYIPQHGDESLLNIENKENKKERFTFLFAGNIGQVQDFDCLIEAIAMIDKTIRNQMLVEIVGSGSYLKQFQDNVKKKSLEDIFVFRGSYPASKMKKFYDLADAFILILAKDSNVSKTIPAKLQGYMAAGKPILACIDGDSQEIIKDAKCGFYGPAGDAIKLKENILKFLQSEISFSEFGTNGRKYYKEHFTLDKFIDSLMIQITEVMNNVQR